ncbi:uncharacterized protein DUF3833 [Palleronia aestuarii]|uniref:Uncharacterized protein DUF3833 n=1 Tax=Palleronia aestuarii TaxID=568105 RepID=A0A2W7N8T0_9RHOB|nr:DUF3833 family protein [Palleronia aestuarii]PZX16591.1 uncharacterized protein DUF3833 [Palleronia aestuarii]
MDAFLYITVLVLATGGLVILRWRFATFRAQQPHEYEGMAPDFDLREHLTGKLVSDGMIFGPTGRMSARFRARILGTWTDGHGVIAEEFRFDGGGQQSRSWRFTLREGGRFRADADDVVGSGSGTIVGPTIRLSYRIVLPKDAGGHTLDVIDWMYLTQGGTIINRSQFRKFGFKVAEIIATIRPDKGE